MGVKLHENQKLIQKLNPRLITLENILKYSSQELIEYLNETLSQNPLIEDYYFEESVLPRIEKFEDADDEPKPKVSPYDIYSYNNFKNTTIKEFLYSQIPIKEDGELKNYIKYIIENIDEDGLLRVSIDKLLIKPFINKELMEKAVGIVKDMEPPGVGSFDIKECLKKQLEKLHIDDLDILKVIDSFLRELADKNYKRISKELSISINKVMRISDLLKSLNPLPGAGFACSGNFNYIIPDIIVQKINNNLKAVIPDYSVPKLKISTEWLDYSKNRGRIFKRYLSEITELEKNINIRNKNLLKIAEYIVKAQEFYLKGESKIKNPVRIGDASIKINLSISTVSRTIKNKYMKTPVGTFLLKDMFSTENTDAESTILDIVNGEDKAKPLNDGHIQTILKEKGFDISRRTVAKYRKKLNILPYKKRAGG